ncbi:hypothetical protein [uncultured Gimesia sp.]|uniref:hypothetical protein n=1 Tax=uncultured Gimesia sp. TaxID=1678688 RepID=UPI0026193A27|nr:hypothetical protein [uncultured Gimesia sp.]
MIVRNTLVANRYLTGLICGLLFIAQISEAEACPFCPGPSTPLTEKLSQAEVAVLATWVSAEEGTFKKSGKTIFEVKEIVHQTDKSKLKVGDSVFFNRHRVGKKGALFLLLGTRETSMIWDPPIEISETCFHYMTHAPALEEKTTDRLRYFLKFLEHPDQKIATDAFAEFANAPFDEIALLADELPREKFRKWLISSKTPVPRLGLYGLLLGLCGQESDIAFMEKKIKEPGKQIRMGIGGLISGYLMLTGAAGLDQIDQSKFVSKDVEFSETYAAMEALSFIWTYKESQISKERMRQSMRLLLNRPVLADRVITNLARWEDWSVVDRLMNLYGEEAYDNRATKRAIVRYLMVASKGKNKKGIGSDAVTAEKAKRHLSQLRKADPKTVESAQRFFFLR